jgi:hypothetical protein
MKIYNVELTNHCNAHCSYCPHSKMTRAKGYMSLFTFGQVLSCMDNKYITLHHFGEPFLHPQLPHIIKKAANHGVKVEFSTNGGILDKGQIQAVMKARPHRIRIAYDEFKPEDFIKTVLTYNESTIVSIHSVNGSLDKRKPFNNFAGSVEGESEIVGECYFKKYKYYTVLWNGYIVPCCQDFDGEEVIGTILPCNVKPKEDYNLCKKCSGMQWAEFVEEILREECLSEGRRT